jgi:hypothetical protein
MGCGARSAFVGVRAASTGPHAETPLIQPSPFRAVPKTCSLAVIGNHPPSEVDFVRRQNSNSVGPLLDRRDARSILVVPNVGMLSGSSYLSTIAGKLRVFGPPCGRLHRYFQFFSSRKSIRFSELTVDASPPSSTGALQTPRSSRLPALLLASEENIEVVSDRLGHAGIVITLDTYARLP